MPPDDANPFFTVVLRPRGASEFDDVARKPEFVAYPSGQFFVQKSDERIWRGALPKEEMLDFLDFLLADARVPSISLGYLLAMPFTDLTEYTLRTRSGSYTHRLRHSGGLGSGVSDGTAALRRVDDRRHALAERATELHRPGVLVVITRRVSPEASTPLWAWNAVLPFAAFAAASDVSRLGITVDGERAAAVRDAVGQGRYWRFGPDAIEVRARVALPHEISLPRFGPGGEPEPPASTAPPSPVPAAAPGPTSAPPPTPAAPPPPSPEAPSAPSPPSPPVLAGGSDWREDDLDYAGVQALIAGLKKKASGSPHGTFWTKPYDAFLAYTFDVADPAGTVALVTKGDGAGSNLIRGLKGEPLKIRKADGTIAERAFDPMPPGKPLPAVDVERIRRWIDRGAPEKKPGGAAPADGPAEPTAAPSPSGATLPPASPTPAAASGPGVILYAVGEGMLKLPPTASAEDGHRDPVVYVARDEAGWKAIFDVRIPASGGPTARTIAEGLKPYRDGALGYDYGGSQLLLLVSPLTDNYEWTIEPRVRTGGGAGRWVVAHRHEARTYARAPDLVLRWAIYRSAIDLPPTVTVAPN
jgi:hypothetical protein